MDENIVVPGRELFEQLQVFNVADKRDGCWVYHRDFEKSVRTLNRKGLSRLRQMNIARKASKMGNTLVAYKAFRDKKSIEQLIQAYCCLDYHMSLTHQKLPPDHDNLVYAVWYLNDHKPEVER